MQRQMKGMCARPRFRTLAIATCTVAACAVAALAQTPDSIRAARGELRLTSGNVTIAEQTAQQAASIAKSFDTSTRNHFLIQFSEPLSPTERAALKAAGVNLLDYVDDNAYFARVSETGLNENALATIAKLRAVQNFDASWKLDRPILTAEMPSHAIVPTIDNEDEDALAEDLDDESGRRRVKAETRVAAYVAFHQDVTVGQDEVALVEARGGWVRSIVHPINILVVEMPYASLISLANEDRVMFLETPIPRFDELNAENRAIVGANTVQAAPYNLDGTGITVMVYDGGTIRTTHQDFGGRAVNGDTDGVSDHATHVSGTVGGDGTASGGANRGMAPNVNFVNYGFETGGPLQEGFLYTDPGDLLADYTDAIVNGGADISNNSIGTNTAPNGFDCNTTGNYHNTSRLIDEVVRGDAAGIPTPMRIVWANGNERTGSGRCLGVEGWPAPYHSTSPPACAKNHITVGALDDDGFTPASFTSYGPSDDGRLKPDVCAPGVNVLSCSSSGDTNYNTKSGTSMASPTVCGVGALLMQDYQDSNPGAPMFRNSTLKTLLAHSAADEIGPEDNRGPDYKFGYGLIQAEPAVNLLRTDNWIEDSVDQGETYSFLVFVGPSDTELKVTLAWDDAAATPLPASALVNDLDLQVFDTANTRYFPWTLDTTPTNPGGAAVRTQEDHTNNIEQVVIDAPAPGVYRVDIVGFNVPMGPQPFSVAATPQLINCSSAGIISLSGSDFACEDMTTITVVDCDLNTDDSTIQTVMVSIASDSEAGGEMVLLTETAPETAAFEGMINLSTTDAAGVLLVAEGDTVTATYDDADDGTGSPQTVTAMGTVDCTAPTIIDVQVSDITPTTARITITTDEETSAQVDFGLSCGVLDQSASANNFETVRVFNLTGLADEAAYFFTVSVADRAGNTAFSDNGGACFMWAQPVLNLPFVDNFTSTDFDLNNWAIVSGATIDDVGIAEPSEPFSARFNGDPGGSDSLTSHLIDLSANSGRLSYWFQQTGGGDSPENNDDLIIEFKDANGDFIEVNRHLGNDPDMATYQQVNIFLPPAAAHGAFRLRIRSEGTSGAFDDWFVDDVSITIADAPLANNISRTIPENTSTDIQLDAFDPNGDPLDYMILSLPSDGTLEDLGDNSIINAVPYTLVGGGDSVRYTPPVDFGGAVSFDYMVSDGTNDSNVATVSILVEAVLSLPFFDDFPTTTFDPLKWSTVQDATIDTLGIAEPSEPNAARFNGDPSGGDVLTSQLIDLSINSGRLTYWFQQTGGGDSPETGDDLIIEFQDANGDFIELNRHLGSEPDMNTFQQVELFLPPAAAHNTFRLRIRCTGTAGSFDDWFVDDIGISIADAPVANGINRTIAENTSTDIQLDGFDPNGDPLEYTILSLPSDGTLEDLGDNSIINAVPYTLVGGGDSVRYTPPVDFAGAVSFDYLANDGTNDSNVATVNVFVEPALTLPFFDDFPTTTYDPLKWADTTEATIDDLGIAEPSGPNAARFNGFTSGGDTIETFIFDLSDYSEVRLSYHYQRTGGGESPDGGDDLFVEYQDSNGDWQELMMHLGSGADMTTFELVEITLPAGALHESFRLRVRSIGTSSPSSVFDDWFVDDIGMEGDLALLLGDMNCDGLITVSDIGPFVLALTDPAGYAAQFPDCDINNGDINQDGFVTVGDIGGFVALLTN